MRKPARANVLVAGVASQPATAITLDQLKEAIAERAGTLINEASDLGEDGHYRYALRRESTAGALLDVLEYLRDGEWPKDRKPGPEDTPSEELADRYEELVEEDA